MPVLGWIVPIVLGLGPLSCPTRVFGLHRERCPHGRKKKNKKRITELARKFEMIGFSSLFVDPDGYKTGKLNQLSKILK